jgi:hypothetical protein
VSFLFHVLLYSRLFVSDYPILKKAYSNAAFKLFNASAQEFAVLTVMCCHVWIITPPSEYEK